MITNAQRILLTEQLLHECWHDIVLESIGGFLIATGCRKCDVSSPSNRTFTTWQDFGDCWEAMKKREDWRDFLICKCYYVFDTIRFPVLCAEWLEEKGG